MTDAWFAVVLTVSVPEVEDVAEAVTEQTGAGLAVVVMLQAKFTVPLKPPEGTTAIVDVAEPPADTVAEVGLAVNVKLPPPPDVATVKVSGGVVVWVTDPEVPVTVTVDEPTGVAEVVLTLSVEMAGPAPGVTGVGATAQVSPAGTGAVMVQVRLTALLKPFNAVTVTAEVADPPGVTIAGENAAVVMPKSATAPVGCLKATACMTQPGLGTFGSRSV
jgi:hypothetical protein